MNGAILSTCILIFAARIVDVSLGTIRTICVVNGRRHVALVLGFFEILVWIFAVSKVIGDLQHPVLAVAYALGFATGNFVGITIEKRLALESRSFGSSRARAWSWPSTCATSAS